MWRGVGPAFFVPVFQFNLSLVTFECGHLVIFLLFCHNINPQFFRIHEFFLIGGFFYCVLCFLTGSSSLFWEVRLSVLSSLIMGWYLMIAIGVCSNSAQRPIKMSTYHIFWSITISFHIFWFKKKISFQLSICILLLWLELKVHRIYVLRIWVLWFARSKFY